MRPGARFNCKSVQVHLDMSVAPGRKIGARSTAWCCFRTVAASAAVLCMQRTCTCTNACDCGNPHTSSLSIDTCSNQSAGLRSEYTRSVEQQRRPFSLSCSVVDMTYKSSDVVEMILVPGIFSHASTPGRSSHRIEIWSHRRYDELSYPKNVSSPC